MRINFIQLFWWTSNFSVFQNAILTQTFGGVSRIAIQLLAMSWTDKTRSESSGTGRPCIRGKFVFTSPGDKFCKKIRI